ncbi:hypothetical protein CAEBREN_12617 [Caenorhabditis brenneri]|uniref:Uncharacterized protein n=1 Tax=Caenorhabditis brenneri TaxID=135651 RepID=G0NX46_CAEBE|nr:hypothetical protein CAEBREN_12617 [Caenorhabditis brenneri]
MFKQVKSEVPEDSVPPPSGHATGSRIVDVIELDDDEHVTVPVAPHLPTAPLISDDTGPATPGPADLQMDAATFHHLRGVLAAFFPQFAQAPSPYMTPHQGAVANHQFPPPVPSPYVSSAPGTSSYVAAATGTVAIPQFPSNQMSFPPPPLGTVPVQSFPHHQISFPIPTPPAFLPTIPRS